MSKLEKRLIAISKLSKRDTQWIHKDIFRILCQDEIWILAYQNIKSNKGALTPGSTHETMDGISMERLNKLKEEILTEKYKFKPVKRTYIIRPDGRNRPLGLPTANDKIVQEVMRIILEAIYEPIFSKYSFGFRKGFGCHDALKHVDKRFRWVDFVIEGDIEQAYPTIDHTTLVKLLEKRIKDPRFIRLIRKLLKCGILDNKQTIWSKTGVPQGSIVSPLLANIYYHELDEFVKKLTKQYETPEENRKNLKSSSYKSLEHKIGKVYKKMKGLNPHSKERQKLAKELKIMRAERLQTVSAKEKITRIEYVRYADDWMIGVSGDRKLAGKLKAKVAVFMETKLLQKLHPTKTSITDIRKGNAHFLGYDLFLPRNRPITRYKGKGVITIRKGQRMLRMDIPVAKITDRYVKRGYLKQLPDRVRPISRASYSVLEDHVIVSHYRSIWLGIKNYYSGCTNRGRLQYIHYLLHMSCVMTLGHRHRMSCSKIFKKYKKELRVKIPNTKDKTVSFPYQTQWRFMDRKWLCGVKVEIPMHRYKNLVSRSPLGLSCIVCNSENKPVEMHHAKHVRKNGYRYKGFHQQMSLLNRKQVPLCKDCHQKVHSGKYNGPSLETLRKLMRKECQTC